MPVPELELSLRTRGRAKAAPVSATYVRVINEADLALLASGRGVSAKPIVRLRDRHHAMARLVALGKSNAEISAITGYCASRVSILKGDPSFKELVQFYTEVNDGATAEFIDRATLAAITAVNNLQDMLEDDESPLPPSMQLEIAKTFADRVGHAPVQRSSNVNVNATVELGSRLAAARARLKEVQVLSVESVNTALPNAIPSSDFD